LSEIEAVAAGGRRGKPGGKGSATNPIAVAIGFGVVQGRTRTVELAGVVVDGVVIAGDWVVAEDVDDDGEVAERPFWSAAT